MPKNLKIILSFLFSAIIIFAMVAVTYFNSALIAYFPSLPETFIPIFAACVVTAMFFIVLGGRIEDGRARDEFVSIITHKFRTPLTNVKWAIEMLRNNITEQQKQDILAHIENSNQRLMEIVDLMVGFAQFDKHLEYAYEATSVREIMDVSLQKYGDQIRAKNVNFQIRSEPQLPFVVMDKRKIQFVIDMLIDNAIKYTPSGGVVTLTLVRDRRYLQFSIHDTGIGVSWAERRNIFKKFYRSSNARTVDTEGMGLGLYVAKTIIKKHHGRIWLESKGVGKGTTFFVALRVKS